MSVATVKRPEPKRRIPDDKARVIRTMLSLKPDADIPEAFQRLYWGVMTFCNRMGHSDLHPHTLALIALMSGGDMTPPPPPTMYELYRDRKLAKGDPVQYSFDGKNYNGFLSSVDAARKKITIRNSRGERLELDGSNVWMPTPETVIDGEE